MKGKADAAPPLQKTVKKNMPLPLLLLLVAAGLVLLASGSNLFIKGAVDLARYFGISELIIGLTLAAIGTSLPELAASLAALRHKESGLLIGNVIGSNMFNLFMVLGLTGLIKPFSISPTLLHRDLPVMLVFTLILIPVLHRHGGTQRWHGVLFLGAYFTIASACSNRNGVHQALPLPTTMDRLLVNGSSSV